MNQKTKFKHRVNFVILCVVITAIISLISVQGITPTPVNRVIDLDASIRVNTTGITRNHREVTVAFTLTTKSGMITPSNISQMNDIIRTIVSKFFYENYLQTTPIYNLLKINNKVLDDLYSLDFIKDITNISYISDDAAAIEFIYEVDNETD